MAHGFIRSEWSSYGRRIDNSNWIMPIPVDLRAEATRRLSFSYTLFDSLKNNDWKLYKEAIVVEVLPTDLDDARMGRTPYKTLGRILKARKFLGFPKEIFGAV